MNAKQLAQEDFDEQVTKARAALNLESLGKHQEAFRIWDGLNHKHTYCYSVDVKRTIKAIEKQGRMCSERD